MNYRAILRLRASGRAHRADVRPLAAGPGVVELALLREDCKRGPVVALRLDDARDLMRALQAACDRAHHLARAEHKNRRADEEAARILERVAAAVGE